MALRKAARRRRAPGCTPGWPCKRPTCSSSTARPPRQTASPHTVVLTDSRSGQNNTLPTPPLHQQALTLYSKLVPRKSTCLVENLSLSIKHQESSRVESFFILDFF